MHVYIPYTATEREEGRRRKRKRRNGERAGRGGQSYNKGIAELTNGVLSGSLLWACLFRVPRGSCSPGHLQTWEPISLEVVY